MSAHLIAQNLLRAAERGAWMQTSPMPKAAANALASAMRKFGTDQVYASYRSIDDDCAIVHYAFDPPIRTTPASPPARSGGSFEGEWVDAVPEPSRWLAGGHPVWDKRVRELRSNPGRWMRLGPYHYEFLLQWLALLDRCFPDVESAWRWTEDGSWLYVGCGVERVAPADLFVSDGDAGGPRG